MALKLNYYYEFYERNGTCNDSPTTFNNKMGWIAIRRQKVNKYVPEFKICDKRSKIKGNTVYLYHATDGLNYIKLCKLKGLNLDLNFAVYTTGGKLSSQPGIEGRFVIPSLNSAIDTLANGDRIYKNEHAKDDNDGNQFVYFLSGAKCKKVYHYLDREVLAALDGVFRVNRSQQLNDIALFRDKINEVDSFIGSNGFIPTDKHCDLGPLWQILMIYYKNKILIKNGGNFDIEDVGSLTDDQKKTLIILIQKNTGNEFVPVDKDKLIKQIDVSKATIEDMVKENNRLGAVVAGLRNESSKLSAQERQYSDQIQKLDESINKLKADLAKYISAEEKLRKKLVDFRKAEANSGKRRLVLE